MPITVALRVALRALARNTLRTILTMLGIVIGVAAVIAMVALGNGAQAAVESDVQSAGANLVFVSAGNYVRGGDAMNIPSGLGAATTLTAEDAQAIAELPGVDHSAATVSDRMFVTAGASKAFGVVQGTDAAFPLIYKWTFDAGTFFGSADVRGAAHVAVLGRQVAQRLFPGAGLATVVGQQIELRGREFRVTGVTASVAPEQADAVFIPYTTLQAMLGIEHLHGVTVAAATAGEASPVARAIEELLRARHGLPSRADTVTTRPVDGSPLVPDDFTVRTQAAQALTKGLYTSVAAFALANLPNLDKVTLEEMSGTLSRANSTMTALLAGIAAVSLIVGGIGIMNIMLVAVTERTQEIGIRRAVGARGRDVLVQFLVEAVMLSVLGGLAGIGFGFLAAAGIERLLEWPTRVSTDAVLLAFAIAVSVGVFFGFYPARKASQLDPITALRYE